MRHTQLYFETKKPQFWVLDPSICLKKLSIGSRFKNLLSCVYWRSRLKKKAGWVVNKAIQRWPHEKASRLHNKYRAGGTGIGSGLGQPITSQGFGKSNIIPIKGEGFIILRLFPRIFRPSYGSKV